MVSLRNRVVAVLVTALALTLQLTGAVTTGVCSSPSNPDLLQKCLYKLNSDAVSLPSGPCGPDNWTCICTKQQGYVDCYSLCPDQMGVSTIEFNKKNCDGQHDGIKIAAVGGDVQYTWSNLTDILQGATPSSNGTAVGNTTDAKTTFSPAATPPSNAAGNASSTMMMTTMSQASGAAATSGDVSAAAPAAVVVREAHVALFTITLSLLLALATATLL